MTISAAVAFLEKAFDVLNKEYFESALSKPLITIQSTPGTYGHYTKFDAWKSTKTDKGYREINLGKNIQKSFQFRLARMKAARIHPANLKTAVFLCLLQPFRPLKNR